MSTSCHRYDNSHIFETFDRGFIKLNNPISQSILNNQRMLGCITRFSLTKSFSKCIGQFGYLLKAQCGKCPGKSVDFHYLTLCETFIMGMDHCHLRKNVQNESSALVTRYEISCSQCTSRLQETADYPEPGQARLPRIRDLHRFTDWTRQPIPGMKVGHQKNISLSYLAATCNCFWDWDRWNASANFVV